MNAPTLITLCRDAATHIYGTRCPTPAYGESVAQLLMGTAATESHLVHRRQVGYDLTDNGGAWGLWQTEAAAVSDNLDYLRRRHDVRLRAAGFLWGPQGGDMAGILNMGSHGLMRLIYDWDRFAVLCARLHYMRQSEPVPATLGGQAAYWKRHYNTTAGKGTPEKYITDWTRLVAPALEVH